MHKLGELHYKFSVELKLADRRVQYLVDLTKMRKKPTRRAAAFLDKIQLCKKGKKITQIKHTQKKEIRQFYANYDEGDQGDWRRGAWDGKVRRTKAYQQPHQGDLNFKVFLKKLKKFTNSHTNGTCQAEHHAGHNESFHLVWKF